MPEVNPKRWTRNKKASCSRIEISTAGGFFCMSGIKGMKHYPESFKILQKMFDFDIPKSNYAF